MAIYCSIDIIEDEYKIEMIFSCMIIKLIIIIVRTKKCGKNCALFAWKLMGIAEN